MTGSRRRHEGGLAAEEAIERLYLARGGRVLDRRVRIGGGEIDLIVALGGTIVFVEVKSRRTRDAAAHALGPAQAARLHAAAEAWLAAQGDGTDRDCRFDLALVDGQGAPEIVENALIGGF